MARVAREDAAIVGLFDPPVSNHVLAQLLVLSEKDLWPWDVMLDLQDETKTRKLQASADPL